MVLYIPVYEFSNDHIKALEVFRNYDVIRVEEMGFLPHSMAEETYMTSGAAFDALNQRVEKAFHFITLLPEQAEQNFNNHIVWTAFIYYAIIESMAFDLGRLPTSLSQRCSEILRLAEKNFDPDIMQILNSSCSYLTLRG